MLKRYPELKGVLTPSSVEALERLNREDVYEFLNEVVKLCEPQVLFVRTDSLEDAQYIRKRAVERGEEKWLKIEGHTVHFDGIKDQARDKENTRFLIPKGMSLGRGLNVIDRDEGLNEIQTLLKGSMKGKEAYVLFLGLGPVEGPFSIYAIQVTDSAYVAHSEDILYRPAYESFVKERPATFFRFIHSAGELDERNNSKNVDLRRVYIDFQEETVYSVNTQYAGNTVGMKKLALRLAIRRADKEGWLAEHMFLMAVKDKDNEKVYLTGAYPSACGKTSTCMVEGENIVGDDISYLKVIDGKVRAVNVERGIFGIIKDVNPEDDPLIWKVLNTPGEVIFSNVLVVDGIPYWQGDGRKIPEKGENFSGDWFFGKKDEEGREIPFAHPNARYTIRLSELENCDLEALEKKDGVEVNGIIYGGRDSDTWVPVFEAFSWQHGVITIGASLESETTAATLGKVGVRKFNPMANLDFVSIPVGKYISNYLEFGKKLDLVPKIFGVNYFQKDEKGNYLTGMHDKRVWLKWMAGRIKGYFDAFATPIGLFPYYEDLERLFKECLGKSYPKQDYERQFSLRVKNNLEKINRMIEIYSDPQLQVPQVVLDVFSSQKILLEKMLECKGELVSPFVLQKEFTLDCCS